MKITKIEKKNLVEEVYKQMYNMILSGNWQEGSRLPSETFLADQFNVSRVVIREAMSILRNDKYIITRQGSGSYISNPNNYVMDSDDENIHLSEDMFNQLVTFRNSVEKKCIDDAVKYATDEDLERVELALEGMRRGMGNLPVYSEADYQFHYSIAMASHNIFFVKAYQSCKEELYGCFYELNKLKDSHEWGFQSHQKVAEQLRLRNAKAAKEALGSIAEYNSLRYSEFFDK